MNSKGVLFLILLAIVAISELVQGFQCSGAAKMGELGEGEPLAKAIFELFSRDLEVGAGHLSKRLENNKLKLIRGAKFRTIQEGMLILLCQRNHTRIYWYNTLRTREYML